MDMKVKNEGIEIATDVPKIKEEPQEIKISPVKRKGKSIHTNKVKREKSEEDATKWEPENWRELLQNIKAMREDENAPVDSQGCERTADETETPEVMNYFCSCNCYSEILILFFKLMRVCNAILPGQALEGFSFEVRPIYILSVGFHLYYLF